MAKRQQPDPYADHARPADYVATVEIWTDRTLALTAIEQGIRWGLAESLPVRATTAVRVTVSPRRRT